MKKVNTNLCYYVYVKSLKQVYFFIILLFRV
nr:MAG TPA: hypothetical protein [Caudoviricetes sp.]